jgi:hypothetical protein
MPLRDHFRGWLRREIDWHSFHNGWAMVLAGSLNARLPEGYRASPNVQKAIEIDVAAYGNVTTEPNAGGAEPQWQPSGGTLTVPFDFGAGASEVLVHGWRDGRFLAGAIELVSESNKDRRESREAFVSKCETYLHGGAGLVIVDAVTVRGGNLHDELMARVGPPDRVAWGERFYATAYRPTGKNGSAQLTMWEEPLALGAPLPTVPLWLLHGPCVPVFLEATYEDTFRQLRLPTSEP